VRSRKNIKLKKLREVEKYLVYWKRFTVEYDTWEKKKDLRNARKVVDEFEGRMSAKVRRQEKLDMMEEKDFRRGELLGKYTAKMLFG